eukprot:CAMPEP_0184873360 /NCGR_PEP_ID=MMETSP0580-20130426/41801_1 /TAXON_ID=1118495 /ORGANISM="Dactyliosolen fragilissimus" /LENGTH=139 /DNA_ID=CAMNT_0027376261 /DNA_START=2345 /DNA_END=2764 /DNA_ORIENTATION=+
MVTILEAEEKAFLNQFDEAQKLFKKAIEMCGEALFLHDMALACERCALNHIKEDGPESYERASHYLAVSFRTYSEWGATKKADFMLRKYDKYLAGTSRRHSVMQVAQSKRFDSSIRIKASRRNSMKKSLNAKSASLEKL